MNMRKIKYILSCFVLCFCIHKVHAQSTEFNPSAGIIKSPFHHLELRNKGLIVQRDFSVINVNTAANTYTLLNSNTLFPNGDLGGTILDPGGNGPYLQGVAFSAEIIIRPPDFPVYSGGYQLTFDLLDLPDINDSLIIYDSDNPAYIFNGTTTIPPVITIRNPNVRMVFKTDNDTQVGQGFVIRFKPIEGYAEEIMDTYYGGPYFEYSNGLMSISSGINNYFNYKNRGVGSFSHGTYNYSPGYFSFTIGSSNVNYAQQGFAMGSNNYNSGNQSIIGGIESRNTAFNSLTVGQGLVNKSINSTIVGSYNDSTVTNPQFSANSSEPENPVFIVANGLSHNDRSNAFVVRNNGNATFKSFTQLGEQAPSIKMKEISGLMPANNGSNTYAHGLADAKILSIAIAAEVSNQYVPPAYTANAQLEYHYYWAAGSLYILNKNGNSSGLAGVPFKALITYKE